MNDQTETLTKKYDSCQLTSETVLKNKSTSFAPPGQEAVSLHRLPFRNVLTGGEPNKEKPFIVGGWHIASTPNPKLRPPNGLLFDNRPITLVREDSRLLRQEVFSLSNNPDPFL